MVYSDNDMLPACSPKSAGRKQSSNIFSNKSRDPAGHAVSHYKFELQLDNAIARLNAVNKERSEFIAKTTAEFKTICPIGNESHVASLRPLLATMTFSANLRTRTTILKITVTVVS